MPKGKVKYFDAYEGYGYIVVSKDDAAHAHLAGAPADAAEAVEEIYVDGASVTGFEPLEAGQEVSFEVRETVTGREAVDVEAEAVAEVDPA